jgi:Outer membrane protein beta-barrel domain
MKRVTLCAIAVSLALVLPPRVEAQTGPMRIGLTGGAATSSVGGDYVQVGNWTWGGVAGAFGQYFVSRETYIGLEANWVQKGGDQVAFTLGGSQDLKLEYIEIPLTLGYTQRFSGWESNLYLGLALSFEISCKTQGTSSNTSVDCDDVPGLAPKQTTDWSIPFGFGFMKNLGGSLLGLDIRYVLGLSDIFENSNIRNRSWQFTARWAVPIGS